MLRLLLLVVAEGSLKWETLTLYLLTDLETVLLLTFSRENILFFELGKREGEGRGGEEKGEMKETKDGIKYTYTFLIHRHQLF